jgi:UrcA family protein
MKVMIAAIAVGFIAGSLATPARADPSRSTGPAASEQISYADLDLASVGGQRHLKDRISFAVYRLCLVVSPASPSPAIADPRCYRKAMTEGLSQMQRAIATAENRRVLAAASQQQR